MVFKMTGSAKQKALVLLGLVMLITMLIAASLSQFELQPGMPLPRLEHNQVVIMPIETEPLVAISIGEFVQMLFILILAGSMLYVTYMLLKGANWKDLTTLIRPIVVISLVVIGFIFLILLLPQSSDPIPMDLPMPTARPLVTSPLGPAPSLLLWLVGIGLLVASILIGSWIFNSVPRQATTIDVVGLEAEKAWQALQTGLDLKDVIIKCYRQMSLALEKGQGLEREAFMTTREFENLLEAAGVPHDPIHQLTQLFEAVRYGNWQPNPLDEQKAIHCLEAIMLFSQEAKRTD
jgi:hypothetical protein